jgi:hypothetical protein
LERSGRCVTIKGVCKTDSESELIVKTQIQPKLN